jgi:hypothetical protein
MLLKTLTWRILLAGLLVLLTMSQASEVSARNNVWTSIGPEGGCIFALAIDPQNPNTLYAGTSWRWGEGTWGNGVFKTTEGGGNWVNTGLTGTTILALAIDPQHPNTVYAGTEKDGVFVRRYTIIPDYVFPGISNTALVIIVAGIIGTLMVFGVGLGLGVALAYWRRNRIV